MKRVFAVVLLLSASVRAEESSWLNASGGAFGDRGNWTGGVPGDDDTALFALDGTYAVDVLRSVVCERALFRSGAVTLDLQQNVWSIEQALVTSPSLAIGDVGGIGFASVELISGSLFAPITDLGVAPGSDGVFTIEGPETLHLAPIQLRVGFQGAGTLTVREGATLLSGMSSLAALDGSTAAVTIEGAQTTWECSNVLTVGKNGSAALTIGDSATMISADVFIGQNEGADGLATLTGAETTWTVNGSIDVGFDTVGQLVIRDGAHVAADEYVSVGTLKATPSDPPGTISGTGMLEVTGAGSLLEVGTDLHLSFAGTGTMVLGDGGRVVVGDDFLRGAGSSAEVEFRLSEADVDAGAMLQVSGKAKFDSPIILQVTLAPGFQPQPGSTFTLVSCTALTISPSAIQLPPLAPLLSWEKIVSGSGLQLVVRADADLNGDGVVDGADLGILLGAWGVHNGSADLNGDAEVDGADLGLLLGFWTD